MLDLNIQVPIQTLSGIIHIPVCSKKTWDSIRTHDDSENSTRRICGALGVPHSSCECNIILSQYTEGLTAIRKELKLTIPVAPVKKEQDDVKYTIYTCSEKLVADYAGVSIYEAENIPILEYWLLERDAFIHAYSKSEKGREYLNNAYRLEQVEADEDLGGF